jgi:hypothetical protein
MHLLTPRLYKKKYSHSSVDVIQYIKNLQKRTNLLAIHDK